MNAPKDCLIVKAKQIKEGDTICFVDAPNLVVASIKDAGIGGVWFINEDETYSTCLGEDDLVYVLKG